jgi:hypothetical protein
VLSAVIIVMVLAACHCAGKASSGVSRLMPLSSWLCIVYSSNTIILEVISQLSCSLYPCDVVVLVVPVVFVVVVVALVVVLLASLDRSRSKTRIISSFPDGEFGTQLATQLAGGMVDLSRKCIGNVYRVLAG